jgi:hypothetical protein
MILEELVTAHQSYDVFLITVGDDIFLSKVYFLF